MFANFNDFNVAESKMTFDKSFGKTAALLAAAAELKGKAHRLPQRYRRGYTNVQTLVVNKDTGEVSDQTTEERISALKEYFFEVDAQIKRFKDMLMEFEASEADTRTYQEKLKVDEQLKITRNDLVKRAKRLYLTTELCGSFVCLMWNTDPAVSEGDALALLDVGAPSKLFAQVKQWDSATWDVAPIQMPNRRLSGGNSPAHYVRFALLADADKPDELWIAMYTFYHDGKVMIAYKDSISKRLTIDYTEDGAEWHGLGSVAEDPDFTPNTIAQINNLLHTDYQEIDGRINLSVDINIDPSSAALSPCLISDNYVNLRMSFYSDEVIDELATAVQGLINS
jgi:hypothetical protein